MVQEGHKDISFLWIQYVSCNVKVQSENFYLRLKKYSAKLWSSGGHGDLPSDWHKQRLSNREQV